MVSSGRSGRSFAASSVTLRNLRAWGVTVVSVLGIVGSPGPERSLRADSIEIRRDVDRDVHAFYYPWYASKETDGRWEHWNHAVIERGGGSGRQYEPPDDIGANFYPALGLYSSNSEDDLREHMQLARRAGIGTLAVSWWGRGSFEDRALPRLLRVAGSADVAVCFHIEPYPGRDAMSVRDDLKYLRQKYGESGAVYRRGGKPLVYVYDSYLTDRSSWARILTPEGDATIRGTDHDAVVIGLYVKKGDEGFLLEGGFDGFYTYFATRGFTDGSSPANWSEMARWARRHDKLFIPSVGPGYDDTRIRPWNARNRRDREDGKYYDRMFSEALAVDPDVVSITSFNEWHEGTQIEPAAPRKSAGYTYLDYRPLEPDHYIERTRHWVECFRSGFVMTVNGSVSLQPAVRSLVHEHVLCDFSGARVAERPEVDPGAVAELVLPRLRELRDHGVRRFFDCTPEWIGRSPVLLRRLSRESGIQIVTNTGWYGAAGDKYLPAEAFEASVEELARRWIDEWRRGIGDTGVRPGFVKIGVDPGGLDPVDRRLVRAAAVTHRATGLTIACHTGEGEAALDVLEVVQEAGVSPAALVVVHADGIQSFEVHERLARAGAWLEYDGVGARSLEQHVERIQKLVAGGLAWRLLLSHDAGWFRAGEPRGAPEKFRPYTALFDDLLPALEEAGVDKAVVERVLRENPAEAFRVRIRPR